MTYPPQQPGPYGQDPYQQQPGPYGPNNPWAGQQPGFPVGPPPKKSRGGLIATLIIVAILVVGGGGAGLYFLLRDDNNESGGGSGDNTSTGGNQASAKETVDTYVEELGVILNTDLADVDLAPLEPLACADDFDQLSEELEEARDDESTSTSTEERPDLEVTAEDFKEEDDGATFTLVTALDGDENQGQEMTVSKEGDGWVVCGLYADDSDSPPSSTSGSEPSGEIPNPIPTT